MKSVKMANWKKIIKDELIYTGGGCNYYITFYRHIKHPLKQIEIFQDAEPNTNKRNNSCLINLGTRFSNTKDKYDFIQGDYYLIGKKRGLKSALKYAQSLMRKYKNGEYPRNMR